MKILTLVFLLTSSGLAPKPEVAHLSPNGVDTSFTIVRKSSSQAPTPNEGSKTKIIVQENDPAPEGFQYLKSGSEEPEPGLVGVLLKDNSQFSVDKRVMKSTGEDSVILRLAKSPTRPTRTLELTKTVKADYNEWRRSALQRTAKVEWPPKKPSEPRVPKGTLVIVGGGGMTKDIVRAFIDAGGGDNGHFVVLPISMPDPINVAAEEESMHRMGIKNVTVIPYREKSQLEDPKVIESLKKATGIWFGGGRQWNFVDAYEGTKLPALFRDVLNRGGVIGGSSAGATIQGDYMVRGAPAGPGLMMCEGYERAMGFLPGVAIDQHFSARNRFKDMTGLMSTYPQFLGIGLDEATAIVVKGGIAEVLGRGNAHFYDSRKVRIPEAADFDAYPAGSKYDLVNRRPVTEK
jgi:cyanophycinase